MPLKLWVLLKAMHGFDFGFSSFTSGRWYIFIVDFSSYFWFAYCTLTGSYLILNFLDFDCYGFIMSINYKEMSESSSFVELLIEEQGECNMAITDDSTSQQ